MSEIISAGDILPDDGRRFVVVTCPHDSLEPGEEVSMSEAYNRENIFIRVADLTLHAISLNGAYVTVREIEHKEEHRKEERKHKESRS